MLFPIQLPGLLIHWLRIADWSILSRRRRAFGLSDNVQRPRCLVSLRLGPSWWTDSGFDELPFSLVLVFPKHFDSKQLRVLGVIDDTRLLGVQ